MKKKVIVLSLGGSLIIPDEVNVKFLNQFKKVIKKNTKRYKFIITTGGGSVARKYINALEKIKADEKTRSMAGIGATRMNARFMNYFFGYDPEKGIPHSFRDIKKQLKKRDIVFVGTLKYKVKQTSDGTAAEIAQYFKSSFINLTNINGLYDKNPKEHKGAKFIPWIPWKDFYDMANKMKFKPGQHFVLDQSASKMILENRIPTYIIGKNIDNLNNLLNGKKFKGTTIEGKHGENNSNKRR